MVNFIAGLPRASSTILCELLSQNPEIHTSTTSPMLELVEGARRVRTKCPDFKAMGLEEVDTKMQHVLRGIIEGWYEDRQEPVCFDKCRGWLEFYPLIKALLPEAKIIVCIRDVRGCVASMEKKARSSLSISRDKGDGPFDALTTQSRADKYLSTNPLGTSIERLFEASQRGFLGNCLIVRAEDLGANPERELHRMYSYLGLPWFDGHKYTGLARESREHDHIHAPFGDHSVEDTVAVPPEDWDTVLGEACSASIKERCRWFYEKFYPERL